MQPVEITCEDGDSLRYIIAFGIVGMHCRIEFEDGRDSIERTVVTAKDNTLTVLNSTLDVEQIEYTGIRRIVVL